MPRTVGRELNTILCVDDNEAGLSTRKMLLEAAGYRVLIADRPRKALEILNQNTIDLAILDFRMPEMDGCQLGNEIRSRGIGIPLIMLTGWLSEVPASCVFSKTIQKGDDPRILLESIATAITKTSNCSECNYNDAMNTCPARNSEESMNTARCDSSATTSERCRLIANKVSRVTPQR